MTFQSLFSGKNKKYMSSTESAQTVIKVNMIKYFVLIEKILTASQFQ